jgi:hypothetical protein
MYLFTPSGEGRWQRCLLWWIPYWLLDTVVGLYCTKHPMQLQPLSDLLCSPLYSGRSLRHSQSPSLENYCSLSQVIHTCSYKYHLWWKWEIRLPIEYCWKNHESWSEAPFVVTCKNHQTVTTHNLKTYNHPIISNNHISSSSSSLAWQPIMGHSLPRISWQQDFYGVGQSTPCQTPNLQDQASVFMTPGDRVTQLYPQALGTHFCRRLLHAWAMLGLFLSSGHHMEKSYDRFM